MPKLFSSESQLNAGTNGLSGTAGEAGRQRAHGLALQRIGAEVLLYDERTHRAFCLNPVAAAVWDALDGTRDVRELGAVASAALGAQVEPEAVRLALLQLDADGLLEPVAGRESAGCEAGFAPVPPAVTRRSALAGMGAGAALLLPAVAAIVAPRAAQAYSGCVNCASFDVSGAESQQAGAPVEASRAAVAASQARQAAARQAAVRQGLDDAYGKQ